MKTEYAVKVSVAPLEYAIKMLPELRAFDGMERMVELQAPTGAPPDLIDMTRLGTRLEVPRAPRGPKA